ncbi:MAG: prepilin-type N-terminal cleavage/methylation domain-containing protein [Archangium sp.]
MSRRALRSHRGMTLLEVMVAALLLVAVMAVAMQVVGVGVRVARQNEQTTNTNDSARLAAEVMLRDIRIAGSMQGIFMSDGATGRLINPMFTEAGPNGTDALWVVTPSPRAMQTDCTKVGSGVVVATASGSGPIAVNCTAPLVGAGNLLVTNFSRSALITPSSLTATSVTFSEGGIQNYGPYPEKGGMLKGDMVLPVQVVRYSVSIVAPCSATRPCLLRQVGNVTTNPAAPFTIPAGARTDRYNDIEDLQIAWGSGTPVTFNSGHSPLYNPATAYTAMRINVVGVSPLPIRGENGALMALTPVTVEDHAPAPVVDGYRRSVYRRRVELLNNGALNL